jgi:2-oxoisovalerate ferredoxin oxidoreductase beta subunit
MKVMKKPQSLYDRFERKPGSEKSSTHYCPGCGHGIVHKLVAELLDEMGLQDRSILISPVGCSVFAYYYFDVGNIQAAHGRAPAVATGVKRARPDSVVISYQGDGDLAAIGGNNILQAANRGENITVIFINNAIYGMTGGQLAPTSPLGMRTATTPEGREFSEYGNPMRVAELLSGLDGVSYSARCALTTAGNINKTKKAIKKALTYQVERKGFSIVEVLSQCPTGWKVDPVDSLKWIEENMMPVFPLGTFKDKPTERRPAPQPADYDPRRLNELFQLNVTEPDIRPTGDTVPWRWPEDGAPKESLGIKAAGFGGQGILLLGELLATMTMQSGLHATWLPSYGPEMRGGTANCSVVMSTREVGNPLVDHPDVLIAMNRPSLERFEGDVVPGGTVFFDSGLIDISGSRDDVRYVLLPATEIANELGSSKVANTVMLGALSEILGFPEAIALNGMLAQLGRTDELKKANQQAAERGREEARKQSSVWA